MSVRSDIPEVSALRKAVEMTAGFPLRTHNAFISLSQKIEVKIGEHISESTLERIWNYSTRVSKNFSGNTLEILSRYAGFPGWENFCKTLKEDSGTESEEIKDKCLDTTLLKVGDRIRLAWLPNRIVTVRYEGLHRFSVLESKNSSLNPGDSFDCLCFQKGRELYLDNFCRAGSDMASRYVVGLKSGLTLVQVLQK